MKQDEMGRAYSMDGKRRNACKMVVGIRSL
jgi:hypothetical protein